MKVSAIFSSSSGLLFFCDFINEYCSPPPPKVIFFFYEKVKAGVFFRLSLLTLAAMLFPLKHVSFLLAWGGTRIVRHPVYCFLLLFSLSSIFSSSSSPSHPPSPILSFYQGIHKLERLGPTSPAPKARNDLLLNNKDYYRSSLPQSLASICKWHPLDPRPTTPALLLWTFLNALFFHLNEWSKNFPILSPLNDSNLNSVSFKKKLQPQPNTQTSDRVLNDNRPLFLLQKERSHLNTVMMIYY